METQKRTRRVSDDNLLELKELLAKRFKDIRINLDNNDLHIYSIFLHLKCIMLGFFFAYMLK